MNEPAIRGIGDNAPASIDYAGEETARLKRDYPTLEQEITEHLEEARALPKEIDDDETAGNIGRVIKKLRDLRKRLDGLREDEKTPYLRRGDAVQGFFMGLMSKLARNARHDQAGAADVLQARIDAYTDRKVAREQERRRLEAEETARIALETAQREAEQRRLAEEARQAAERARKPENVEKRSQEADQQATVASQATVEATVAAARAEEAHIATLATPADMVRTRADSGVLLTARREPYAILTDRALVDMNALRPYFTDAEIEKAVRGWAKATGYRQPMPGAEVGHRNKGDVR